MVPKPRILYWIWWWPLMVWVDICQYRRESWWTRVSCNSSPFIEGHPLKSPSIRLVLWFQNSALIVHCIWCHAFAWGHSGNRGYTFLRNSVLNLRAATILIMSKYTGRDVMLWSLPPVLFKNLVLQSLRSAQKYLWRLRSVMSNVPWTPLRREMIFWFTWRVYRIDTNDMYRVRWLVVAELILHYSPYCGGEIFF